MAVRRRWRGTAGRTSGHKLYRTAAVIGVHSNAIEYSDQYRVLSRRRLTHAALVVSVVVYPCSGEGGAWLAAGLELRPRRDLVDVPIEAEARVAVEAYTLHSCTCLTSNLGGEVGKKVERSKREAKNGSRNAQGMRFYGKMAKPFYIYVYM